ncbi:CHASE3 domain-containing protein [Sphingomonas nostoxanthinifaciens]|uniref:CHASE3 domain-containing protein n=1 Tax=Sphingomonas nostoxanthinifaciens TaxID=2872652 RepID=UPI001CC1D693|nr:response regulator [Sphingomonas nostoxanthinifaciens]UAK26396.1 response regulator [Sphingomonas nostoxanthinifaciens]
MSAFDLDRDAPTPFKPPSNIGFVVLLGALLLVLVALAIRVERVDSGVNELRLVVRASYQKRIAAADLLSEAATAESAQRGYLLTGSMPFLAPYEPARVRSMQQFARLSALYRTEPTQFARIQSLQTLLQAKFAEMDTTIRRRETEGLVAAVGEVRSNHGRELMEGATNLVRALVNDEEAALVRNLANASARRRDAARAVAALLSVSALATLFALTLLWRARVAQSRLELSAREGLARLRAVFASTAEGLVTLNPSGTIEDVNAAAARMLGYSKDELTSREISVVLDLSSTDRGTFAERIGIKDGRLTRPSRADEVARGKNGRLVPVDLALGLMPLPDGTHIVVSLRDISERKAAERLKDEFISTVSHELRTPLTSVVGSLGLLRGGQIAALPDQARRLVEIAENNARRLIRLINDILDIDRIGSGKSRLDTNVCDLCHLAERGAHDAEGLAATRGITVSTDLPDEPVSIMCDFERLLQVVGNLVSNAIRFSPDDGTVVVRVRAEGDRALLFVDDSGPGVAPEFRDRIFGRFAQSSAGAAIPGGTGLGLAISREIVKAHDGDIWFDDAPDGGARFAIALPLQPEIEPILTTETSKPQVLVCEDDPDAGEVLRAMIEARGYAVTLCGTAREVQALAQSGRFAGVVLDLALPDASGLSAVRALRALSRTRSVPVIVASAFAAKGDADPASRALDVIDWIEKPVDPQRLTRALDVAMRRHDDGKPTLLHVDDDPDMLEVAAFALADRGRVLRATSLAGARALLAETTPDIVILDLNLPDGSGVELLPELFTADGAAVPTIIYSASEPLPAVARQVDAALVKSRRSLLALSETVAEVLDKRDRG